MSQAEAKNVAPMKSIAALNPNVSEADLVQRLGQVQTLLFGDAHTATVDRIAFLEDRVLELESATQDRFDALAEAFDKRTADMEKAFEQKLAEMQKEMNTRDRQQTQFRRRLATNVGDAIKTIAKDA